MVRMRGEAWATVALMLALAWGGACNIAAERKQPSNGIAPPSDGGGDTGTAPPASSSGSSGSSSSSGDPDENAIPDPDAPCDLGIDAATDDPLDGARAVGLCKQAASDDDWGVVSARWAMADGSDAINDAQFAVGHGVLDDFGSRIDPLEGSRLLALSSGTAREPGDQQYASPEGFDKGYISGPPDGFPKESPVCSGVITGTTHDDVALEVTMRAPKGAHSFGFDFNFYTYEWPVYVCSEFNDFFVALLDPYPDGQGDGNISFDSQGNPVSVNNALVEVCDCSAGPPCLAPPTNPILSYDCDEGDDELAKTGFEDHAATGWLVTRAPAEGGEVIKLRWSIYDSGDGLLDSTVLIDNFRWLGDEEENPGTVPK